MKFEITSLLGLAQGVFYVLAVGGFASWTLWRMYTFYRKAKGVEWHTHYDLMLNKLLVKLLGETDAIRAYILEFHNGMTTNGGHHPQKMSCHYERTHDSVRAKAKLLQSVPCSWYPEIMEDLTKFKEHITVNVDSLPAGHLKGELKNHGIGSYFIRGVHDVSGELVGFVAVDYAQPFVKGDIQLRAVLRHLDDASLEVGALLTRKAEEPVEWWGARLARWLAKK